MRDGDADGANWLLGERRRNGKQENRDRCERRDNTCQGRDKGGMDDAVGVDSDGPTLACHAFCIGAAENSGGSAPARNITSVALPPPALAMKTNIRPLAWAISEHWQWLSVRLRKVNRFVECAILGHTRARRDGTAGSRYMRH